MEAKFFTRRAMEKIKGVKWWGAVSWYLESTWSELH